MDFDLDDPLGDLLSDDSNDSFFQITKKGSERTREAKPFHTGKHSPKVGDLFGIDGEPPGPTNEKTDRSLPQLSPVSKVSEQTGTAPGSGTAAKASITSTTNFSEATKNENQTLSSIGRQPSTNSKNIVEATSSARTKSNSSVDLLDELGFNPKNTKAVSKPKSNIIDDMLNLGDIVGDAHITSTLTQKTPAESRLSNDADERLRSRGAHKSMNVESDLSNNSKSLNLLGTIARQSSTDRRSNRVKGTISKPLSTFDWLGLGTENESANKITKEMQPISTDQQQQQQQQQTFEPSQQAAPLYTQSAKQLDVNPTAPTSTMLDNNAVNSSSQLENRSRLDETLFQSLHQQANQLHTTISIKQQENVLVDMHRKQQSLIEQQERQFNDLIQRQSNRQMQLEQQIQQQQQQIHSYINTLLQQSTVYSIPPTQLEQCQTIGHMDQSQMHEVELEAEVKRLELEKIRLEDTLENIRSTHDQEMELVKGSHKKQIELYEESSVQLEQRLQNGLKYAEDYHSSKYNVLKTDMDEQKQQHEDQINKMRAEYEEKLTIMRSSYTTALDSMKSDQLAAIETIRQTKLIEFATVQDSTSYLQSLKSASNNLSEATENLQMIRTNMEANVERLHTEKEIQLTAREQRLNGQQKAIDKLVDKTEEERTRLIDLVRTLEMKLASVEQSSSEQQWMFRQKSAVLDAERLSFEREKTFVREKHETEEKRIKVLEEKQYAEYKRLMDIVDTERELVWSEKSKLQTLAQLKPTASSSAQRQIELDAAIQIAQDASKSADAEREKFVELQRKFEMKRRELIDREKLQQNKEIELDIRSTEMNEQKQISERAVEACKTLEQKLHFKLRSLMSHHAELIERENKLSEAKVQLSANRMELQRIKQRIQQSRCSLCRIGVQNQAIAEHENTLDDVILNNEISTDLKRRSPVNVVQIEKNLLDDILLGYGNHSIANRLNGDISTDSDALLLDLDLHTH